VGVTFENAEAAAAQVVRSIEAIGGRAMAIRADNRDEAAVIAAINAVANAWGRLDILVNSAGVFRAAPVDTLSLEDFDITLAVNLRAAFIAIKAAAPLMTDGGRIISIGSNLAVRATDPGLSAYTASKAGLAGLTQAVARDLGPRGITVNVVHPGSTDTDMNPADGPDAQAQRDLMAGTGGFAKPEEIADVVAYLASPAARAVTGAAWTIDGGANA
jgi:NAD(P)-dependent dehydrogenase (short-subunit alcohol dehydrogenase family)